MQTNQSFMPSELCVDTVFMMELSRLPFSIRVALIGGFIIVMIWVICDVARRLLEPPVMTVGKWQALRILARSAETMSTREVASASRGELSSFMLALQLRQLEGFGLVHRWHRSRDPRELRYLEPCHDTAYDLTTAGKALLDGIVQLNRYGVLQLQSPQPVRGAVSSTQNLLL